ncbi:MAG: class II aldolase/adducin family protein [Candidatus Tectomicrobia bacterium]|uniref:Class II aldolase/adducin family protein n=1 Tax=Tectimicrobiota bacterium TaxID=2528274 RepID=A0A932GPE6_UNCTE|nr:class II aldolase/adducin family protein [Candidatus Tectomicrobia bacterium]
MDERELHRDKLAKACRFLYREGILDAYGHLSARVPGTGRLLINPKEIPSGEVRPESLVEVSPDGRSLSPDLNPPAEVIIHSAVYRARPDVGAVAHFHPPFATAFATTGKRIVLVYIAAAIFHRGVPFFEDPQLIVFPEQAERMAQALGSCRALMLRNHGAVVVGRSIEEMVGGSVILEENAKRLHLAWSLGQPQALTPQEIEEALTKYRIEERAIGRVWTLCNAVP